MRLSRLRILAPYALAGAALGCVLGWALRPSDSDMRDQARRLVPAGFSIVDIVHEPTNLLLAQREAFVVEARGTANPSDISTLTRALDGKRWRVSGVDSRPNGGQVDGRKDSLRAYITTVGDRDTAGQFTRLTVRVNRDAGGAALVIATALAGAALATVLGWFFGRRQHTKTSSTKAPR